MTMAKISLGRATNGRAASAKVTEYGTAVGSGPRARDGRGEWVAGKGM